MARRKWCIIPQDKAERMGKAGFDTKLDDKGRYWVLCTSADLYKYQA